MKYLAFDLETYKEIPEDASKWQDHRPLGITCAALVHDIWPQDPVYWYAGMQAEPQPRAMNRTEIRSLVMYMLGAKMAGCTILTWNGLGFDFNVLAEESGMFEECRDLALSSVDMMFHFFCNKGYPLSIQAAADGMGIGGKTKGMNGALAPILWKSNPEDKERVLAMEGFWSDDPDENRQKVLEYVGQDSIMTLEVCKVIENLGRLNWHSRSGRKNTFYLPDNKWLTVRECTRLPYPNASWISNPIPRHQFTDWLVRL